MIHIKLIHGSLTLPAYMFYISECSIIVNKYTGGTLGKIDQEEFKRLCELMGISDGF